MKPWEEAVLAVEHDEFCRANYTVCDGGYGGCDCTRDARIAKGIAAVRDEALSEYGFDDEMGNPNVPMEQRCEEYDARTLAEHIVVFKEATV